MSRKNRPADEKIALVIWRNVIVAIIIILLIVARQWIAQANMQQKADFLDTILFYVLILAVLLQIALVFLPGQRKLYASFEQMRFLGEHDRLTELYHPYTFQKKIEEETAQKRSKDQNLSLLLLDINELPTILQKSGRHVADEILRRSAQVIKSSLKAQDYAARLQNDTLVMLIRGKSEQEIRSFAELLLATMKKEEFPVADKISFSAGIATYHDGEPVFSWMSRSEAALVQARSEGKNRIVHESMIRTQEIPGAVRWLERWASGHEELDSQHRLLVDLGNQLLAIQVSGSDDSGVPLLLEKFQKEITSHFGFEEKLMRDIEYPYVVEHSIIHERLTNKAVHMIDEFEAHNLTAGFIYSFLVEDIIVGHIETEDTRFFPMISQQT